MHAGSQTEQEDNTVKWNSRNMYREKYMNFKQMEELSQEGITDEYGMRFM